jgi:hypothetical protein
VSASRPRYPPLAVPRSTIISRNPHGDPNPEKLELARSTEEGTRSQLARLEAFHGRNAADAPAMLRRLRDTVIADGHVFEALMHAVRDCGMRDCRLVDPDGNEQAFGEPTG